MSDGWVWTRPALRVACRVVDQVPASIADLLYVTACRTGRVDLQVPRCLPLVERIAHVEQIAARLGAVPVWEEYTNQPGTWYFGTRGLVVDGIGVDAYTSAHADEMAPVHRELAGVDG
jgi:hypothetical protein